MYARPHNGWPRATWALRPRWLIAIAVALLVTGCAAPAASTTPNPSADGPSPIPGSNLPSGCAPLELLAPDGSRVELQGAWQLEGDVALIPGGADWKLEWIRQVGDCLWGVILPAGGATGDLVIWSGRITSEFVIRRTLVQVTSEDPTRIVEVMTRLAFTPDGVPFLCSAEQPQCPDSIGPANWVERPMPPGAAQ